MLLLFKIVSIQLTKLYILLKMERSPLINAKLIHFPMNIILLVWGRISRIFWWIFVLNVWIGSRLLPKHRSLTLPHKNNSNDVNDCSSAETNLNDLDSVATSCWSNSWSIFKIFEQKQSGYRVYSLSVDRNLMGSTIWKP